MADDTLETTDKSRLAQMLAPNAADQWHPREMAAILKHQLSAPLEFDLSDVPAPAMTFGELLHHPHPPVEMLQRVKRFAKACKVKGEGPLPPDVATVLYFASIVIAWMRCGTKITELDGAAIRTAIQWALAQSWLDDATRSIFEEARALPQ